MKIELYELAEELNQLDESKVLNSKDLWQRLHFMDNNHRFSGEDYEDMARLMNFQKMGKLKLRFIFGAFPKHVFVNRRPEFIDLLEFACNDEYQSSQNSVYISLMHRLNFCRFYFRKEFGL